ncbi:MAG: hypothetical protein ACI35O_00655 [Bacillaceae bacterium]
MQKILLALVAIFLILVTGCSIGSGNEKQRIEVKKFSEANNQFEDFRKIKNDKKIQKAKELLNEIDWETANISISHPPDYQFTFQVKNQDTAVKSVLYRVWVSPTKDKLQIIQDENQYAQLTKEQSAILFEIITGDTLTKQK